jgi:hypothetical protein
MKPDRMGYSLLPFTRATASHTRWGVVYWNEFEASNVLTKCDGTEWNAGAFAPVSLTVGWDIPQHCVVGLWLSPDMAPETGVVKVEIRDDGDDSVLCAHEAVWTRGGVYSVLFPRAVHTSAVRLTFTQSPSWIALFWVEAWQCRGEPTVVKTPVSLVANTGLLQQRRRSARSLLRISSPRR